MMYMIEPIVETSGRVHNRLSYVTFVTLVLQAVELHSHQYVDLVLLQLALKQMSSGLEPLSQLFVDLVLPNAY
jgi:CheY-like chemotaxis protein